MKPEIFENALIKANAVARERKKQEPTNSIENLTDQEKLKEYRKQLRYLCYGGLAHQLIDCVDEELRSRMTAVSECDDMVSYCTDCDSDKQLRSRLEELDIPARKATCNNHRVKYAEFFNLVNA